MRYLIQLLIVLALIPMDVYSASAKTTNKTANKSPNTVKVQGKVVKQTTVRDNKGKKQSCQVVVDSKTKRRYTVCHP
jgi:hypothetical protein